MLRPAQLIQDALEAYRTGRSRPVIMTPASSGSEYSELLTAAMNVRLSSAELNFLDASAWQRETALAVARSGNVAAARRMFDACWKALAEAKLSQTARLLADVFLCAADAYCHYRCGDNRTARVCLYRASQLDHALVTQHNFAVMSAHRLQLVHNLLRIQARLDETCELVQLGGSVLNYLEFREDSLPVSVVSPRSTLDSVSVCIIEYYFNKICGELALCLTGASKHAFTAFRPLLRHCSSGCRHPGFGAHGHAWLQARHLALSGDMPAYLAAAIDLLRLGRQSEPALWFATATDVAFTCRSLGGDGASYAQWLLADLARLADAPPRVRRMVRFGFDFLAEPALAFSDHSERAAIPPVGR